MGGDLFAAFPNYAVMGVNAGIFAPARPLPVCDPCDPELLDGLEILLLNIPK